jgi:hypothetical protein
MVSPVSYSFFFEASMECKWQKDIIDAILLPIITVGGRRGPTQLEHCNGRPPVNGPFPKFFLKPQGSEIYSRLLYWFSLNPVFRRGLGKPYGYY